MKILRVTLPLHITCVWQIVWGRDYTDTGSVGAGLNLHPHIYLEVRPWIRDVVIVNGREFWLRHVTLARELLGISTPLRVDCLSVGELGFGYALSSAITIASCLYALTIGKATLERCLDAAHVVEVKLRTGLGDVVAQTAGGPIEVRLRPGAPSRAIVRRVPVKENVSIIVTELEVSETTPDMLVSRYLKLQTTGRHLLERLREQVDLDTLLHVAYIFSKNVGFLTNDIEERLRPIRKWVRGLFVKKRLLVLVPESDRFEDVREHVKSIFGGYSKVKILYLSSRGLTILS